MDQPLSFSLLDELVLNFIREQNSIRFGPRSVPGNTAAETLAGLHSIREHIECGRIETALEEAGAVKDALFSEEIKFLLLKQQFVEMVRNKKDPGQIIQYCSESLCPLALHATIDSYRDYLDSLLVLVFDEGQESAAKDEWSQSRRTKLATLVYMTLCNEFELYECSFSMSLRYLSRVFDALLAKHPSAANPQIDAMIGKIFRVDKDVQATSDPHPRFLSVDRDCHHLINALSLSKTDAIKSMQAAHGNLAHAFKNELMRVDLDYNVLFGLIKEYCDFRGIEMSGFENLLFDTSTSSPHHQELMRIRKLNQSKRFDQVLQILSTKHGSFLQENQRIHFSLLQFIFVEFLMSENLQEAYAFAQTHFAPFITFSPEFYDLYKETVVLLAFDRAHISESDVYKKLDSSLLASQINSKLVRYFGVEVPRFVLIMNRLLDCHTKWFERQRCDDPFKEHVPIHRLKQSDVPEAEVTSPIDSSEAVESSEQSRESIGSDIFNEDIVLMVMDVTGVTRGEALALLLRFGGDLDAMMAVMFP